MAVGGLKRLTCTMLSETNLAGLLVVDYLCNDGLNGTLNEGRTGHLHVLVHESSCQAVASEQLGM